jgi:hypothetical protein
MQWWRIWRRDGAATSAAAAILIRFCFGPQPKCLSSIIIIVIIAVVIVILVLNV